MTVDESATIDQTATVTALVTATVTTCPSNPEVIVEATGDVASDYGTYLYQQDEGSGVQLRSSSSFATTFPSNDAGQFTFAVNEGEVSVSCSYTPPMGTVTCSDQLEACYGSEVFTAGTDGTMCMPVTFVAHCIG